jgi:hypothetical protein
MIEALDQALHATTAMMGSAPEVGARTDLMGSSEAGSAVAAAVAKKRITPKPMTSPRTPQVPAAPAPRAAARPVARPVPQKSSAMLWTTILLLLAAGGGGGYWWYSQRPAVAAAPAAIAQPPAVSDDSVTAKIKSTMSGSSALRDVEVTVKDGVVNLGGHAAKFSDADTALALVSGLPGVKEVHNNISTGAIVESKEPAAEVVPRKEPAPRKERVFVPKGPDARTLARVRELVASGNRQVDSGDYQTAINAFQSALVLDPNSTDAEAGLKRANQAKQTEEDILRRRK